MEWNLGKGESVQTRPSRSPGRSCLIVLELLGGPVENLNFWMPIKSFVVVNLFRIVLVTVYT